MSEAQTGPERRPVNSHATVYVGKDEQGEEYNVYNADGDLIKTAKVAPQGTLYVGHTHAGDNVYIEPA